MSLPSCLLKGTLTHPWQSFFFFLFYFLTLQYCIGFAIYHHESATGIHLFPIMAVLIPAFASSSPVFLMMYSAYKLNKQGDNIQPWRTPLVLEKTLESPLDCKEIQPVHSKGDQSWVFLGRTDAKAETPILWPPHEKSWLIGKDSDAGRDWGQEKRMTEDEMAGWHHRLDGRESEWTPEDGDGQGGLACCDSWRHKVSDTTEWLNWTELNWPIHGTFHDFLSREDASIHLIKVFIVKDYLQVCFHARLIPPMSRTLYYYFCIPCIQQNKTQNRHSINIWWIDIKVNPQGTNSGKCFLKAKKE